MHKNRTNKSMKSSPLCTERIEKRKRAMMQRRTARENMIIPATVNGTIAPKADTTDRHGFACLFHTGTSGCLDPGNMG